ncbi:hypothetical protein D9756_005535 [Leucocoprinus leucothites]|uniref:Uncharacterized protein n=1 Tax=Leucocoprinus leucothites TaxID=201217 RepID=A0A8H5G034_9AGAR|nr:hypothetical protein D9756_005535 [Leucoagaricus leucothites]
MAFASLTHPHGSAQKEKPPLLLTSKEKEGPSTPVLTKRQHVLHELLSSERAYASDLALIREVHIPLALGKLQTILLPMPILMLFCRSNHPARSTGITAVVVGLFFAHSAPPPPANATVTGASAAPDPGSPPMTPDDVKLIFGNITEIAVFSDMLCQGFEEALGDLLEGGKGGDHVGALFLSIIPELERLYKQYIIRHPTALNHLQSLPQTLSLQNYLSLTQHIASALSHAWDLSSLLIKPVQRFLTYPLLLSAIIGATSDLHSDKANLIEARRGMEEAVRNVNEGQRRAKVVRDVLMAEQKSPTPGVAIPVSVSLTKFKSTRVGNNGGAGGKTSENNTNEEAILVSRLESELHSIKTSAQLLAKNIVEWARMTSNVMLSLRTWSLSFSKVIGLSPTSESEAFDAYLVIVEKQLIPLCVNLEAVINERVSKELSHLLMTMAQPLKLLASMNEQEPFHFHLMTMTVSPKNRPPPSLLSASANYLALRGQLAAELPTYISLLHRGLRIFIHRLAAIQTEFYAKMKDQWATLWEMLRSEDESIRGGEETVSVWFSRWHEVNVLLRALSVMGGLNTGGRENETSSAQASNTLLLHNVLESVLPKLRLKEFAFNGTSSRPHIPSFYDRSREIVVRLASSADTRSLVTSLKDHKAQRMADFLNEVLIDGGALSHVERKHIVHLLAKLATSTQVFPKKYEIKGIECDFSQAENEGAFGLIYKGKLSRQTLCIKAVRMYERTDSSQMLKAHAKDFILSTYLRHPNVLPSYGVWLPNGTIPRVCIVSPWMENGDLSRYLRSLPQTPPLPLISDAAAGLQYLHELDIIHSDLKANNILVSDTGRAVIADFGVSKILMTGCLTSQLSRGTINWMAPELLLEDAPATRESDVWAFGCVCYEVFTGKIPFSQYKLPAQLITAFARGPLTPSRPTVLRNGQGSMDNNVWEAMQRCWGANPASRPTARELSSLFNSLNTSNDRPPVPIEKDFPAIGVRSRTKRVDYADVFALLSEIGSRGKA